MSASAEGYQNVYLEITGNYIDYVSTDPDKAPVLTLVMSQNIHSCGLNDHIEIRAAELGYELFDVMASAVLAAIMANKKVDVALSGCIGGNRGKVVGLRIE